MAKVDKQPKQKKSCSSRLSSLARSICNPQKKEFLGRTASSWGKIVLFYLIYYACLAGFFAVMLAGLFSTIDNKAPTQQDMYSLIKANPGMGFRPMPNKEKTLIKFNQNDRETYTEHIESIKEILKGYNTATNDSNVIDCDLNDKSDAEQVCFFGLDKLGSECTEDKDFGYSSGKPCILLKVNKVYNFMPKAFDNDSNDEKAIKHQEDAISILRDRFDKNHIGISCEGENHGDIDNLKAVDYYPNLGFSLKFFPYLNQQNYRSPLMFVQFPNLNKGTVIQVMCKLWAKNIKHHKNDRAGSVHFELLVDQVP